LPTGRFDPDVLDVLRRRCLEFPLKHANHADQCEHQIDSRPDACRDGSRELK
jgi:hypothetical protein